MNATCPQYRYPTGKIFTLALLLALAAGIAYITLSAHSGKHSLAPAIKQAYEDCGEKSPVRFINPATGRTAHLCEFEPGQYGRIINEKDGQNVTCYASSCEARKNTLRRAVLDLVHNGYNVEYVDPALAESVKAILGTP